MVVAFVAASTWRHPEPIQRWLDKLPDDAAVMSDLRHPAVLYNLMASLGRPILPLSIPKANVVIAFHGRLSSSSVTKLSVVEALTYRIPVILCGHDDAKEQVDCLISYEPVLPGDIESFAGGL